MGKDFVLAAQLSELRQLGLNAPGEDPAGYAALQTLPGITYHYDEVAQKIDIQATDEARIVRTYNARGESQTVVSPQADFGLAVNYDIFASSQSQVDRFSSFGFSGVNLALDARVFGPMGTFYQSAILGTTTLKDYDSLRLDSTWTFSDPEDELTYRAGDIISGGLAWTRPIRLGGAQVQRNFSLRPDLVTVALPKFSGSAALPSTVDVYVNNLKSFSQQVEAGPFEISNLPVVNNAGARVVLQDAQGRQTTSELPFFVSPRLLKEGLIDFSAEVGFPRLFYGVESWKYDSEFAASSTFKYGVTDDLTIEAHSEFSPHLANAGLGASFRFGDWGVASIAAAGSFHEDRFGAQVYGALDTEVSDGINLHLSTQRTFGTYDDLASTSGVTHAKLSDHALGLGVEQYTSLLSLRPPKALDTASLSIALPFDNSSVTMSYIHVETEIEKDSNIVALSYSRPLWDGASGYVSAFADFADKSGAGVFAGVSIPLGGSSSALVGVASRGSKVSPSLSASQPLDNKPGSYGWRVDVTEGDGAQNSAALAVRTDVAKVEAGVRNRGKGLDGTLEASGAIVVIGGDVFATNRIDDAFAVVDTGYADTEVFYENRPAGRTNSSGKLLVPGLRAYQNNQIAVNPLTLPLNAELPTAAKLVAPADRSGVVVDMRAKDSSQSALVTVMDAKGAFLPAGTAGKVTETGETFVVGYDGQAYLNNLGLSNSLVMVSDGGPCRAEFSFSSKSEAQANIGSVVCR